MKPVINIGRRDGATSEGIDAVPKIELLTQLADDVILPGFTSWLPREVKASPVHAREKPLHVQDVFRQRLEFGGALKQYRARAEGFGTLKCCIQPFANGSRGLEKSRSLGFCFISKGPRAPFICRASRLVRDQLPGLEREFEIRWSRFTPFL